MIRTHFVKGTKNENVDIWETNMPHQIPSPSHIVTLNGISYEVISVEWLFQRDINTMRDELQHVVVLLVDLPT